MSSLTKQLMKRIAFLEVHNAYGKGYRSWRKLVMTGERLNSNRREMKESNLYKFSRPSLDRQHASSNWRPR